MVFSSSKLQQLLIITVLSLNCVQAKPPEQTLNDLAQDYYNITIEIAQPYAYFNDISLPSHEKFIKNTPNSLNEFRASEDSILNQLYKIETTKLNNSKAAIFYSKFVEKLESSKEERICRTELWNLSHMFGAHTLLDFLVKVQPIDTEKNKQDAIQRWSEVASYYEQEIKNLNLGLKLGYSAPKRVVKRLIFQLKKLTALDLNQHPFLALLEASNDRQFNEQFSEPLSEKKWLARSLPYSL